MYRRHVVRTIWLAQRSRQRGSSVYCRARPGLVAPVASLSTKSLCRLGEVRNPISVGLGKCSRLVREIVTFLARVAMRISVRFFGRAIDVEDTSGVTETETVEPLRRGWRSMARSILPEILSVSASLCVSVSSIARPKKRSLISIPCTVVPMLRGQGHRYSAVGLAVDDFATTPQRPVVNGANESASTGHTSIQPPHPTQTVSSPNAISIGFFCLWA